jgi:YihY family inner membrane protein
MARSDWSDDRRVVRLRRRWPIANTVVLAINRFRVHRTGRNSALLAHYGFLSIFPLMLVFTTIVGFVLEDNEELQKKLIDSAMSNFPMIGNQLINDPTQISGSVPLLIIGLATALWSGLKAFNVLQTTLDDIADVPFLERPTLVKVRLRSLIAIGLIGGSQVAAVILSGLAAKANADWSSRVLLATGTVALNTTVLTCTYHWLCSRRPAWASVLPGAVFAGFFFTVLQVVGAGLVTRAIARASPIYGTFATVIGLLFWLSLHAMITLLGAEMNGVLPLHRFGDAAEPPLPIGH